MTQKHGYFVLKKTGGIAMDRTPCDRLLGSLQGFVDDLSSVDSKGLSDKTCDVLVRRRLNDWGMVGVLRISSGAFRLSEE